MSLHHIPDGSHGIAPPSELDDDLDDEDISKKADDLRTVPSKLSSSEN